MKLLLKINGAYKSRMYVFRLQLLCRLSHFCNTILSYIERLLHFMIYKV